MATKNPVLGHVKCPNCADQMQVKQRRTSAAKTAKLLGYCPSCKTMLQKNDDQTYLAQYKGETPSETPVQQPETPVAVVKDAEDWTPEKSEKTEEGTAPAPTQRESGGFWKAAAAIGVCGLFLLGVGRVAGA